MESALVRPSQASLDLDHAVLCQQFGLAWSSPEPLWRESGRAYHASFVRGSISFRAGDNVEVFGSDRPVRIGTVRAMWEDTSTGLMFFRCRWYAEHCDISCGCKGRKHKKRELFVTDFENDVMLLCIARLCRVYHKTSLIEAYSPTVRITMAKSQVAAHQYWCDERVNSADGTTVSLPYDPETFDSHDGHLTWSRDRGEPNDGVRHHQLKSAGSTVPKDDTNDTHKRRDSHGLTQVPATFAVQEDGTLAIVGNTPKQCHVCGKKRTVLVQGFSSAGRNCIHFYCKGCTWLRFKRLILRPDHWRAPPWRCPCCDPTARCPCKRKHPKALSRTRQQGSRSMVGLPKGNQRVVELLHRNLRIVSLLETHPSNTPALCSALRAARVDMRTHRRVLRGSDLTSAIENILRVEDQDVRTSPLVRLVRMIQAEFRAADE